MTTICRSSLAALAALALAACDGAPPKFKGTDITGAEYGKQLELTDHHGKARRLEDFRGKAVVLFFGFTRCPDVCPTTLADAALAMKKLGPDADRVQMVLVTVDPERRIARARALLEETDLSVTDIAFATGFGSLGSFRRQFARATGTTPRGYRQTFREPSPSPAPVTEPATP